MSAESQKALSRAVLKLLRPLARLLLRNGVPYAAFADLAKQAYVDVAMNEFGLPGKKTTVSRAATITGLSRKEVKRVMDYSEDFDNDRLVRYHRAARVVYGWVHDKSYADQFGQAAELPFEGENTSFSSLVKAYSGDVPPRAILDELSQVGVVERTENGLFRLLARAYIPKTGDAEKLELLGRDVAGLIRSMDNNIHGVEAPVFQRKVFYDNLPEEVLPKLQLFVSEHGQLFLEMMDQWLAGHDRDINPKIEGTGRKAAGVGVYYFEEELPPELLIS